MSRFARPVERRAAVSDRTENRTNRPLTIGGRRGRSTVSATVYGLRNGLFAPPEAREK